MQEEFEILRSQYEDAQRRGDKKDIAKILVKTANLHNENGSIEKAEELVNLAIKQYSKTENANLLKAIINLEKGNEKEAIIHLKEELKINPKNKQAKEIKKKIEIEKNFPIISITITLISIAIYFLLSFPQIGLENLLKYSLNMQNMNIANLVTSLFIHINAIHLISNSLALLIFGIYIEKFIGSGKTLLIFLSGGIVGNAIQTLSGLDSFVLGSSAGVFAIIGASLMYNPYLEIRLFGFLKLPLIILFAGFFTAENIIQTIFSNGNIIIGSLGHLIGFLIGLFIIGIIYRETISTFYAWLIIAFGFFIMLEPVRTFIASGSEEINLIYFAISSLSFFTGLFLSLYGYDLAKKRGEINV